MKRIILSFVFILISISVIAQNKFSQWTISAAPTYSVFRGVHKIPFSDYEKQFKFTVGGQLHADWGILRRISVGVGVTHHRHQLDISDYTYSSAEGLLYTEDVRQTIDVTGYYFRGLIHIKSVYDNSLEEIDLYWGVQQFAFLFRSFNNSTDPDFFTVNESLQSIPGIVAGVRYYPTEVFGFSAEAALPGPYTISIGAAIRLGGRDRFFSR